MNSWQVFLEYAKSYPGEVPRSMKERSKLYNSIKYSCVCGKANKLCIPLNLHAKIKPPPSKSLELLTLQNKVKILEEELNNRDMQIKTLKRKVQSL